MGILYEYAVKDEGTNRADADNDNDMCFNKDCNEPMSLSEIAVFISTSSIYSSVISDMVKSKGYCED